MKPIGEALDVLMTHFTPRGVTTVALGDALGAFCAERVVATLALPPFDNSAMDGYAVRAAETTTTTEADPVTLPVSQHLRAGGGTPGALAKGTAARIFTGAPMPPGADAVVIQENTDCGQQHVRIHQAARAADNVRAQGSDVAFGQTLLDPHAPIGPAEIGLLASQNIARVTVFERPTVAIMSSGDELVELGANLAPGQIVNSNAHTLAAMAKQAGATPVILPVLADDLPTIIEGVIEGLKYDVLVTTGGVSVGQYDLMQEGFKGAGVELSFWKVAIKPGKPVAFGTANATPVVGLPGNPVSAMVTFKMLVEPGLRAMAGDEAPFPILHTAKLAHATRHRAGRLELARGKIETRDDTLWVRLASTQSSGAFSSAAGQDALCVLPADLTEFHKGQAVQVLCWGQRWSGPRSAL